MRGCLYQKSKTFDIMYGEPYCFKDTAGGKFFSYIKIAVFHHKQYHQRRIPDNEILNKILYLTGTEAAS